MDDTSVLQDDLRAMLKALGMSDHARPQSPHEVFRECIARAEQMRAALRPFAEVPPGGRGVGARMMVTFAGDGPFHFFEGDLVRAKEVYRDHEQRSDGGENP